MCLLLLLLAIAALVLLPAYPWVVHLAGLVLVVSGTVLGTLISRPADDVRRVLRCLPKLAAGRRETLPVLELPAVLEVAELFRHGRVRQAEQAAARIRFPLMRRGVQMVLDGVSLAEIQKMMAWSIGMQRHRDHEDIATLRMMAGLAPAFGMLGTLLGLIQMLQGLGSAGMAQLGGTMGLAISSTLYGVLLGTVVFRPLAAKLERATTRYLMFLGLVQETVLLLHQRQHPRIIQETLSTLADPLATSDERQPFRHAA